MSENTGPRARSRSAWRGGAVRFFGIVLALHIPLYIYPILRLGDWLDLAFWPLCAVFVVLGPSQIISRSILRHRRDSFSRWYRLCADFWLGLSPFVLGLLLLGEGLVVADLLTEGTAAKMIIGAALAIGVAGLLRALDPDVKTIRFTAPALRGPRRFVQISDVHIGSRSQAFLDRVIARVKALEPDFLCITGDFIDATGVSESQLAVLATMEVPVYFSSGNHERYEDFDAILGRLENLGVEVLRSRSVLDGDDIQVIGIDDMDDEGQVRRQLAGLTVADDRFTVLLYHRPRGFEDAAAAGVDLMLSGHTHNGQIVPFNVVVRQVFDRIVGLYEQGTARLYVNSGTGTWGPVMRVGTRSEITLFELGRDEGDT